MPIIHEVATMTAKGQITVPKPIRQALGADTGTKVTFELHENGQVVVSRADAEHEDPAIRAFLDLIENEIKAGRGVKEIPDDVAQEMLEHAELDIDLDEPIEGDVDL
ncbi:MAG: type II toxin-antitoxin system PrlF family antitoxin [bacterium]|nr:type II toxin-antitoxin system PrlF family antitoxin [bacterium]